MVLRLESLLKEYSSLRIFLQAVTLEMFPIKGTWGCPGVAFHTVTGFYLFPSLLGITDPAHVGAGRSSYTA